MRTRSGSTKRQTRVKDFKKYLQDNNSKNPDKHYKIEYDSQSGDQYRRYKNSLHL